MSRIEFYSTREAYGYMSNFWKAPIIMSGKVYPTSEHYFQAMKMLNPDTQEYIRQLPTPMMAANEGRKRYTGPSTECYRIRPDWENVKNDIMEEAVLAKFTQHDDLRQQLLSTGDTELIEHTRNDSYWGDGGNGRGQNWLGKILMRVRQHLKDASE